MAVDLKCFSEGFPSNTELALVVAGSLATGSQDQRHAGFVVQAGDGQLWLFDLAWHNYFRKGSVTFEYAFLDEDFVDPYSANAIIGFLALLHHTTGGKIPYSINYEAGEYFDETTGELLKIAPGQGLSCATFVLEVLSRYGVKLVDRKTWPLTKENEDWQRSMLKKLMDSDPVSIDEFLAQVELVGKVPRIKPEEALGAASLYKGKPLEYCDVQPQSVEVVKGLERVGLL